jgi:hypothetical protein
MTELARVTLSLILGLPGLYGCSPVTPEAPAPLAGDLVTGKSDANTALVRAPDYRFVVGDAVVIMRARHCRHGHCRFSIVGSGTVSTILEPPLLQVRLAPASDVSQGDFVQPAGEATAARYADAGASVAP